MRLIDSLRYHKPTPDERTELNLCSATERVYLHTLGDVRLRALSIPAPISCGTNIA
jgi:hypothetical protein